MQLFIYVLPELRNGRQDYQVKYKSKAHQNTTNKQTNGQTQLTKSAKGTNSSNNNTIYNKWLQEFSSVANHEARKVFESCVVDRSVPLLELLCGSCWWPSITAVCTPDAGRSDEFSYVTCTSWLSIETPDQQEAVVVSVAVALHHPFRQMSRCYLL